MSPHFLARRWLLALPLVGALALPTHATRRLVPQQYATVQAALDAAQAGDTVLVAPGRYFANVVFRGRDVVLASRFLLTRDPLDIRRTILDGSQPANPDTASVIRIVHHEGPGAQVVGFTITKGTGTKWPDGHTGGTYREGGGLLLENSSPTIRYNLIIDNQATATGGVLSAGGGGIRLDNGEPRLLNNVIAYNKGRYGAGVVINYSGAILKNNVIAQNVGGQDFGGGGVWYNSIGPSGSMLLLENNAIVANVSTRNGGGILQNQPRTITLRNNLIWGNTAPTAPQINNLSSLTATYNDLEGPATLPGPTNFSTAPLLADSAALLQVNSPLIDAGDPASAFNELATGFNPNQADFPAQGLIHSDVGAYGGPGAALLQLFSRPGLTSAGVVAFGARPAGTDVTLKLTLLNRGIGLARIDSIKVKGGQPLSISFTSLSRLAPLTTDTLRVTWTPVAGQALADTLLLYHNDAAQSNPRRVRVTGNGVTGLADGTAARLGLRAVPNPLLSGAPGELRFTLPTAGDLWVSLLDCTGHRVWQAPGMQAAAGEQGVVLPTHGLPAGLYVAQLTLTTRTGTALTRTTRVVVAGE